MRRFRMYEGRGKCPKAYTYTDLFSDYVVEEGNVYFKHHQSKDYNLFLDIFESLSAKIYEKCFKGLIVSMPVGNLCITVAKTPIYTDELTGEIGLAINPIATRKRQKELKELNLDDNPLIRFTKSFYLTFRLSTGRHGVKTYYNFAPPRSAVKERQRLFDELSNTEALERFVHKRVIGT